MIAIHHSSISTFLLCQRINKSSHLYYNGEILSLLKTFLLFVIGAMDHEAQETEYLSVKVKLFVNGNHAVKGLLC